MKANFNFLAFTLYGLLSCSSLGPQSKAYMVIWNVGQGQWVTHVEPTRCLHFDMGGETAPWRRIQYLCGRRQNDLVLSHWDWDHISFVRPALRRLSQLCLLARPLGDSTPKKVISLAALRSCPHRNPENLALPRDLNTYPLAKNSNDRSRVYLWLQQVLIPGDCSRKQEATWVGQLPSLNSFFRALILGHHGSRTSTGNQLLAKLPEGFLAIASARKQKYGHPHTQTLASLRSKKAPLLRTQQWGHIRIDYNDWRGILPTGYQWGGQKNPSHHGHH